MVNFKRIEELYNCKIYKSTVGNQEFIDLETIDYLTESNITHIKFLLKQEGYYFYKVEAMDDNLIITYYRK